jgi:hypothetical protein
MTIKESILKSLDDINEPTNYLDVYQHIAKHNYYDFGASKTPSSTISAQLGEFIRNGDARVKRIKQAGGTYIYYLSKNESNISLDLLANTSEESPSKILRPNKSTYEERDLHKLLSSFLKNSGTYSKTIFHEQSNGKDSNQIWTHPDMVGIKFQALQSRASQNLLKSINRSDIIKISSYELKREITSDSELKKAFFQAVSNSSWANYGYLVAFEFSDNLTEEMGRLNQSFGIGIIELDANPYRSKILFPSTFRGLDFRTVDKLCKINGEFEKFIEQIEKLMTAEDRYYRATEKELDEFCDDYFLNDEEMEAYSKGKNIPVERS